MILRNEARDDPLGVHDRRAVGKARVLVLRQVRGQRILLRPNLLPVILVETEQRALPATLRAARDEELVAPDDGLRVALARDGDAPAEVFLRPCHRHALRSAEAR